MSHRRGWSILLVAVAVGFVPAPAAHANLTADQVHRIIGDVLADDEIRSGLTDPTTRGQVQDEIVRRLAAQEERNAPEGQSASDDSGSESESAASLGSPCDLGLIWTWGGATDIARTSFSLNAWATASCQSIDFATTCTAGQRWTPIVGADQTTAGLPDGGVGTLDPCNSTHSRSYLVPPSGEFSVWGFWTATSLRGGWYYATPQTFGNPCVIHHNTIFCYELLSAYPFVNDSAYWG